MMQRFVAHLYVYFTPNRCFPVCRWCRPAEQWWSFLMESTTGYCIYKPWVCRCLRVSPDLRFCYGACYHVWTKTQLWLRCCCTNENSHARFSCATLYTVVAAILNYINPLCKITNNWCQQRALCAQSSFCADKNWCKAGRESVLPI